MAVKILYCLGNSVFREEAQALLGHSVLSNLDDLPQRQYFVVIFVVDQDQGDEIAALRRSNSDFVFYGQLLSDAYSFQPKKVFYPRRNKHAMDEGDEPSSSPTRHKKARGG